MGAINNAFNQAAGAVAVAGRMIGHEKESAINRGEAAKNEDIELAAQDLAEKNSFNENFEKAKNATKDINTLKEMSDDPAANGIKTADD